MKHRKCETCELKGYNPEFCRWHKKKVTNIDVENCNPQFFYKKLCRRAVFGAGIGVVAATGGLAAAPSVGLKVLIGHALAAKLTAGGGAAGAGLNVARRSKKNQVDTKHRRKKRVLLPLYLNKRS